MSLTDALRVAARAIAANGLRSVLTALGMIIGVGSVIVLVAVGQGANAGVQDKIRGLGQDLIFVQPAPQNGQGNGGARGAAGGGRTLSYQDGDALAQAALPGVKGVAAQDNGNAQLISPATNQFVTVIATVPSYLDVRGLAMGDGAFVTQDDLDKRTLVIVLGSDLAATLFPDGGAVGQTVRISRGPNNFSFKVIGVLTQKGGSGGGATDTYAYMPLTTALQRLQGDNRSASGLLYIDQLNIQKMPNAENGTVIAEISDFLEQRHLTTTPDFTIKSQDDLLGAAGQVSQTLSILLGSIAGISLVVGAIGVMNIMLVSVTERTREIGIRRAVGARGRDIILQFVTESLALCIGGGLLGVFIGVGVAVGVNGRDIAGSVMVTVVQPWSIGVAFLVSAGIGALSGSYPAYRASRLDPITALRNE